MNQNNKSIIFYALTLVLLFTIIIGLVSISWMIQKPQIHSFIKTFTMQSNERKIRDLREGEMSYTLPWALKDTLNLDFPISESIRGTFQMSVSKMNSAYFLTFYLNEQNAAVIRSRNITGDEFLSFVKPYREFTHTVHLPVSNILDVINRDIEFNYVFDITIHLVDKLTPEITKEIKERVSKRYQHLHTSDKQKCDNMVITSDSIENLRKSNQVKKMFYLDQDRKFNRQQMGVLGYNVPWLRSLNDFQFSFGGTFTLEFHKNQEGQGFIAVYIQSSDLKMLIKSLEPTACF